MNIKIINRDYTILISGQLVSILGNIINGIAVMWVVYSTLQTGSKTGLLFGLVAIPAIILTPFVGNLIDMCNRKYLLFLCDFINGFSSILLGYLTVKGMLNFWNLLIIFSLDSILFAIVASTRSSLIQNLVKQNEYLKANSINSLVQNIASVSLPMVGSLLIAKFNPSVCFFIDGTSFFIAAFLTLAIKSYKFEIENKESFFTKFKDGIRYLKSNIQYMKFIFFLSIINFIAASEIMLIRILIEKTSLDVDYFGFFKSATAVGSIFIALILARSKAGSEKIQNPGKLMSGSLLILSIVYLFLSLNIHRVFLLAGGLFMGFASTLFNVTFFAYMQTHIAKDFYGRVISLIFFVSQIAQPLSYWIFGMLVDVVSIYFIFLLGSIGFFVVTVFFYRVSTKEISPKEIIS